MKLIAAFIAAAVLATTAPALAEPESRVQSGPEVYTPAPPKKGFRYPECFCTDSEGRRIELGQTTCLQIGSEQVLARCSMSLNNPTWRRISEGCPSV